MEHVNPAMLSAIVITLAALVLVICAVINTYHNAKRKPSADSDLAVLSEKQAVLKEQLKEKQNTKVCDELVKRIDGSLNTLRETLGGSKKRHAAYESKISTQVGDIHNRIDRIDIAVAGNGEKLDLFIDEIRNWRNNHDA